jgi:hypothetical protein
MDNPEAGSTMTPEDAPRCAFIQRKNAPRQSGLHVRVPLRLVRAAIGAVALGEASKPLK